MFPVSSYLPPYFSSSILTAQQTYCQTWGNKWLAYQCLSEYISNVSREGKMAAPQRCPKRRESLMGSIPRRRPSTMVFHSLKFYKCVLENRGAPLSSILVCASKGWNWRHGARPFAANTQKTSPQSPTEWILEEAGIWWQGTKAQNQSTW